MKTINEVVTKVIKDILDQYNEQQANLSSEVFRSQLACLLYTSPSPRD